MLNLPELPKRDKISCPTYSDLPEPVGQLTMLSNEYDNRFIPKYASVQKDSNGETYLINNATDAHKYHAKYLVRGRDSGWKLIGMASIPNVYLSTKFTKSVADLNQFLSLNPYSILQLDRQIQLNLACRGNRQILTKLFMETDYLETLHSMSLPAYESILVDIHNNIFHGKNLSPTQKYAHLPKSIKATFVGIPDSILSIHAIHKMN